MDLNFKQKLTILFIGWFAPIGIKTIKFLCGKMDLNHVVMCHIGKGDLDVSAVGVDSSAEFITPIAIFISRTIGNEKGAKLCTETANYLLKEHSKKTMKPIPIEEI